MKITLVLFLISIYGCTEVKTSNDAIKKIKTEITQSQKEKWDLMVGKWYGSQPTRDGGTRQQITERYPDGTYLIKFKYKYINGSVKTSSEVGNWGISGPIYFSIFRGWVKDKEIKQSNPSDPYNYDAYEIIKLNNNQFKYKSFISGDIYTLEKVTNDFTFDSTI